MVRGHIPQGGSIERWYSTAFLVGGGLLVGRTAMSAIHAFTDLTTPPDVFVTTGHLVALVGLIGLYPLIADRMPILSRAAGVVATVALVSWAVMTVTRLLELAGIVSSLGEALPAAFFIVVLASTILTYVAFGIAILRVDDSSRSVGLLVLAPGVLTVALVIDSVLAGVTALDGAVIGGGLALSMLALGYTLRTWDYPTDYAAPAGEVPTG